MGKIIVTKSVHGSGIRLVHKAVPTLDNRMLECFVVLLHHPSLLHQIRHLKRTKLEDNCNKKRSWIRHTTCAQSCSDIGQPYVGMFCCSSSPSIAPSSDPSSYPSAYPSIIPSRDPSSYPSFEPTLEHSNIPSLEPSTKPSFRPTRSNIPSNKYIPSSVPSFSSLPSFDPSSYPSAFPSIIPSTEPSSDPSFEPSMKPSDIPSLKPSVKPSSCTPCEDNPSKHMKSIEVTCSELKRTKLVDN